jgi:hypothetical protein
MRPRDLRAAIILATLAFAALGLSASASAKPAPKPSASSKGELYDTTPSGGTLLHKSTNHGSTWTQATTADPSSGDDCVTTDQSGAIYECKLAGSQAAAPLQADVWKSLAWQYGTNAANIVVCGTSCSPFGVDRQWTAAYIPPGGTTNTALVVFNYHDFYGPSQIWVNVSTNGGSVFGDPIDVMANFTSNSTDQAAVALANSACNTVPIGTAIARSASGTDLRRVDRIRPGERSHRLQRDDGAGVPQPLRRVVRRPGEDVDAATRLRRRHRSRHLDAVRGLHSRQPGKPVYRFHDPGAERRPCRLRC